MNSKEATRSNSKLVGPSDCQDEDDGVELELISDPTYCKYTDYESYVELLGNALILGNALKPIINEWLKLAEWKRWGL